MSNKQQICAQINGIAQYNCNEVIRLCQRKKNYILKNLRKKAIEEAAQYKKEVVDFWRKFYENEYNGLFMKFIAFIFRKKWRMDLTDNEILNYGKEQPFLYMSEKNRKMWHRILLAEELDEDAKNYGQDIINLCNELILACKKSVDSTIWLSSTTWSKIN